MIKKTKCKIKAEGCELLYTKWSVTQKCCNNPACAIVLMQMEKEKKARKVYLSEKNRLKSKADWAREAQTAVNAYVRLRDKNEPCISCGRHHNGQYHGGHYLSVGARPELRYEESNISKQCSPCNNHLSGNIVLYRVNLIKKIGLDRVEWLEGNHEPKKYTIEELQEIKKLYQQKLKQLQKESPN